MPVARSLDSAKSVTYQIHCTFLREWTLQRKINLHEIFQKWIFHCSAKIAEEAKHLWLLATFYDIVQTKYCIFYNQKGYKKHFAVLSEIQALTNDSWPVCERLKFAKEDFENLCLLRR